MAQAFAQYQQAVIFLAKFGFTAQAVWVMSHLEVNSWLEAYLHSQGVKKSGGAVQFNPATTIVSQRKSTQQGA